tara:strand:- start:872 stop:1297 length:426 start_codon:yes stop_codon:yes gene_type:complete
VSTIKVDAVTDRSGGGTNITIGNTATYVSENSTTTQNAVQGMAKTWGTVEAQATNDSFNNSSDTDVSAGNFEHNFINNFAAANYVSAGIHGGDTGILTATATNWYQADMYTTSKSRTGTYDTYNSAYADRDFSVARFGDLA